ncbi:adenylate/guanylate cyclase domain-containing protein [Gordonia polyisoprenivorans]|uniref:adenylate/guanylate cyclase domain-containing protein n=1 Tax=Gordonia polyisoprenivorans TaxID=84595 RepID=UPI002301130C|nr:adenylate/guanylate cyclase domain-containing protein [Gordonia polyisoprenivorans]WCB39565.1 adenylate/guanylate cyclase domain-containing protein [Gordonia polyisoprenivorans]
MNAGDAPDSSDPNPESPSGPEPAPLSARAADALARADANSTGIRAIRAVRRLLPDAPPSITDSRPSDRLARLIADARPEKPSATRELGLAAVQAWQSVTRRRGHSANTPVDVTILFTDLVAFSTWALAAGDDQVLRLLREVNTATEQVVRQHGGRIVKNLGDGVMAMFTDPDEAIVAAYESIGAVSALTIDGYRPQLRAGLHTGTPRAVGDDFVGVDVNIAARVAGAAGAGELLISDATLESVDPQRYARRRRRRFKAKGVPRELTVYAVVPRYDA